MVKAHNLLAPLEMPRSILNKPSPCVGFQLSCMGFQVVLDPLAKTYNLLALLAYDLGVLSYMEPI